MLQHAAASRRRPREGIARLWGAFEEAGGALSAPYAHRHDRVFPTSPAQLVERRRGELRTRAPERVPEGDRPAQHVELFIGYLERALHVDGLARERLVEFDDVDVAQREPLFARSFRTAGTGPIPMIEYAKDPKSWKPGSERGVAQGCDSDRENRFTVRW